jgi:hypothetical protein
MGTFGDILGDKGDNFNCNFCNKKYKERTGLWRHKKTCNKNDGLSTKINNLSTNGYNLSTNFNNLSTNSKNNIFQCEFCKKQYLHRQGLWRHSKNCVFSKNLEINTEENKESNNNLIEFLVNENKELKNMVMEVCKQIQPNYISNTNNTINSNNKTFNLQVFLNETCKDAMNITDFVNSIQLQLSDLENVGKVGYIEGISNIIIKNLKALDVEKRPVHCTDQKREVIYVKEDNIWEKEDETNKQLRKAIKLVAHKNICMLKAFRDKYPDFDDGDSRKSNQYNKIVIEAMGGKGDNEYEKDTKIIKKIAKVVGIEKP